MGLVSLGHNFKIHLPSDHKNEPCKMRHEYSARRAQAIPAPSLLENWTGTSLHCLLFKYEN
jgi:hypothetical protein